VVSVVFIVYFLRRWNLLSNDFQKKEIKEIAITGLPFIPERFSIFILAYSAGFFINYYKGTDDVGFYSAGMQIATIVNVSILALISIFHPILFKSLAGEPDYLSVRKATYSFVGISLFITLSVIAAVPFVFNYFIGEHFRPGKVYAIYQSISYFFWSVYAVFLGYMLFLKKNKTIMLISIIGMALSVTLNSIYVKSYGAMGAVYTSMIVYFLMAVMMIIAVSRNFNLTAILLKRVHEKSTAHN
jgi:O-antigen/teichoic acid export membrane protein